MAKVSSHLNPPKNGGGGGFKRGKERRGSRREGKNNTENKKREGPEGSGMWLEHHYPAVAQKPNLQISQSLPVSLLGVRGLVLMVMRHGVCLGAAPDLCAQHLEVPLLGEPHGRSGVEEGTDQSSGSEKKS